MITNRWLVGHWALTLRHYVGVTAALFALIAVVQLIRIVAGWPMAISGWPVPIWVSGVVVVVAAFLAWSGFQHLRRM